MAASGSRPDGKPFASGHGPSPSGTYTLAHVAVEDCAFCHLGHLTAPGSARRAHYAQERLKGGLLGGFLTCDGADHGQRCGRDLEWVEDYDTAIAAWRLGGAEAAYEVIRQVWSDSLPLEPR